MLTSTSRGPVRAATCLVRAGQERLPVKRQKFPTRLCKSLGDLPQVEKPYLQLGHQGNKGLVPGNNRFYGWKLMSQPGDPLVYFALPIQGTGGKASTDEYKLISTRRLHQTEVPTHVKTPRRRGSHLSGSDHTGWHSKWLAFHQNNHSAPPSLSGSQDPRPREGRAGRASQASHLPVSDIVMTLVTTLLKFPRSTGLRLPQKGTNLLCIASQATVETQRPWEHLGLASTSLLMTAGQASALQSP